MAEPMGGQAARAGWHRALAALPKGSRITPEVRAFVQPLWAERWTRCEEARRND